MPDLTGNRAAFITTFLQDDSGTLNTLYKKALVLARLQGHLRSALGPPLGLHVSVANLVGETLTLYSDSPAWAARLRFRIPDMYRIAENYGFGNLKSIRIKVIRIDSALSPQKAKPVLSEKSAALLLNSAESIRDERLRHSLVRLGLHSPRPSRA